MGAMIEKYGKLIFWLSWNWKISWILSCGGKEDESEEELELLSDDLEESDESEDLDESESPNFFFYRLTSIL